MKINRSPVKAGRLGALAILTILPIVLSVAGCASKSPAPVVSGRAQAAPLPTVAAAPAPPSTYTVKKGDTLYSIARDHGMDFRELIALNNIESASRITEGTVLKVRPAASAATANSSVATTAPVTSDVVVSRPIDAATLEQRPLAGSVASGGELKREPKGGKEAYSDQALALAQGLPKAPEASTSLPAPGPAAAPKAEATPEARPDAKPEAKTAEPAAGGEETTWLWPANGKLIGSFSEGGSKGIDIAGKSGDAVVATADGKVILANNTLRGYGNMIVIKHNNAWLTVYAHNSKLLVKEGQTVSKGQKIAEMGSSDADQVKLHFEVRRQGTPIDPLKYLPAR